MAVFTWREVITIRVGEMSRASAFDCIDAFDTLIKSGLSADRIIPQSEAYIAMYAPCAVKLRDQTFSSEGTHTFDYVDEKGHAQSITIELPISSATYFNTLPMSLTQLWVAAAVEENGWLNDLAKKDSPLTDMPPSVTG